VRVALSDLTDDEWLSRLNQKRRDATHACAPYWLYYDNEQPLAYIAKILQEQGDRFPPLRVNWSALVVDSLEERLDVEGFRLGDSDSLDDDLTEVWQGNDLDEASGEAHIAALVARESYLMIGPGEGDNPLVTVEYPDQVSVEIDPKTRRVVAALKVWKSDEQIAADDMACLYLPGRTITYEQNKTGQSPRVVERTREGWAVALEQHQTSPLVPVVPMLNRPRRGRGQSELDMIRPLVDAANQTATNMLAAIEHHALPRRWAVNVAESDFTDRDGKAVPAWKIATGAIWAIPRADDDAGVLGEQAVPRVGQFTAADLNNFHGSIRQLALLGSSLYGLPAHYFGYAADNPASADAIRSSEARLVKRAERRQRTFGGAWERAMRIALAVMDRDPEQANRLETIWRDAATPTKAATFDAATKALQSGMVDEVQAQEDAGYTQAQRDAMARRRGDAGNQVGNIVAGLRTLDVAGGAGGTGAATTGQPAAPLAARQPEVTTGAPAPARR
jgi:hypothetical protein